MEVDTEEWFLSSSKQLVNDDVYAARSWLLTAKSIFPQSLSFQIEEYMLELNKKNTNECSKVLNEIFRDFANESIVWEEIEKLIQAVEGQTDPLRKEIFEGLPALTQQRMILVSAECRVNITQYCKLLLVLMNKFPDTISQYGISLTEKLVENEKRDSDGTAVNHCRKLLVREVLPVICRSGNVSVSYKHFYKWLQKSTEFYASYYTCETETEVDEAWNELENLRSAMALQCNWNFDDDTKGSTLSERMGFIRELFRRSRTDVDGAVNRKQIFYTAIILLFEASSRYMSLLDPSIYRDISTKSEEPYVVIADVDLNEDNHSAPVQTQIKKSAEINEAFHVAKEAWNILYANESFEKDFNHLHRRWKCDRWLWFQLYVVNLHMYDGDHKSALAKLKLIEQKLQDHKFRTEIQLRTYCHLVTTYYALDLWKESCENIFRCVSQLTINDLQTGSKVENITHFLKFPTPETSVFPLNNIVTPPRSKLKMIRLNIEDFLPFWVHIFIKSLQNVSLSVEDDLILGHAIVLSQHRWPTWKAQCKRILQRIAEKRSFRFDLFFKFIINVDILEEIAFLKNQKSCRLSLCSNQNARTHVTRGVNREADEEFWNAMKLNVRRGGESVDCLLRDYLITCKDSIVSCLNMVEPR